MGSQKSAQISKCAKIGVNSKKLGAPGMVVSQVLAA
jgi:hypothetical protein